MSYCSHLPDVIFEQCLSAPHTVTELCSPATYSIVSHCLSKSSCTAGFLHSASLSCQPLSLHSSLPCLLLPSQSSFFYKSYSHAHLSSSSLSHPSLPLSETLNPVPIPCLNLPLLKNLISQVQTNQGPVERPLLTHSSSVTDRFPTVLTLNPEYLQDTAFPAPISYQFGCLTITNASSPFSRRKCNRALYSHSSPLLRISFLMHRFPLCLTTRRKRGEKPTGLHFKGFCSQLLAFFLCSKTC